MSSDLNFPAFPIKGWQVGPVEAVNGVVMKFGYCTSPERPNAATFDSQFFSLTPDLARSLIYDLELSLRLYEQKIA
ncbi:hypothetical protein ACQYRI_07020 [Salmonella enterica]